LTELDRLRRESRKIADDFRLRHSRLETDHRATKRLVSRSRHDIGDLIATANRHTDTLKEHHDGLVDHAVHLEHCEQQIANLRIDTDTVALTSVDRTELDQLQARVKRLECRRKVRDRARTHYRTANRALWALYCTAAVVVGGFLSFVIENHVIF
jgi:hypothetical protein